MAYGPRPRPLYGVWIDEALKSNDAAQMREVLEAARKQYPPGEIHVLYGVVIDQAIEANASPEELEGLLNQARTLQREDLGGAIAKLEAHLGRSSAS